MDILFKKYYYDDLNIYNNDQLWKKIMKDADYNKTYTRALFNAWLKSQEDEQTKKVVYKPPKALMHPIIAPPFSYQTDLMFLNDLHKLNNGYSCIINFVEMTTRKAYSYPLKGKESIDVFEAFKNFLETDNIIKNIRCLEIDKGSEYSLVKTFCEEHNIKVIVYNGDKNSMSIVERFNRTLRGYIKRVCKDGKWVGKLNKIVEAYNDKDHSTTDYTPNELSKNPKLQQTIREILIGDSIPAKLELKKFSVGDRVRVYEKKALFGKGSGGYSKTIYTITAINGNSIFLDENPNKKYRYYNVMKVGEVQISPRQEEINEMEVEKKNYKTALKLAKEQQVKKTVKETQKDLEEIMNDNTTGKGKREKIKNKKYFV